MRRRRLQILCTLALFGCGAGARAAAAADAAACRPTCPAPRLDALDPALHRAVHLAWSDPHRELARSTEIVRRPAGAGAAWTRVASVPGRSAAHFDDRGPAGSGLEPGDYEYRLRALHGLAAGEAWSAWSEPGRVSVRAACAEAGGEIAGLPRLVADDRDGDQRYTGEDLERTLVECARLGGCVVEALPVVYDDVAIVFYDGHAPACRPERTACLTAEFPRGLAIEGHGSATVLRSPLWRPPYLPMPLLELWRRPDLRIQLRHLVLDGRKREQLAPNPGINDANSWWHFGFQTWNEWGDHDRRNRGGCIHDVTIRELMSRGISLADVARWNVERNQVEGIGCDETLTPCPRLGLREARGEPFISSGFGIQLGWYSDDVVVRENRVRRVTKYAMGLKHGSDGLVASIRRPQVVRNEIEDTGSLGIFLGGVSEGRFVANRIAGTQDLSGRPETHGHNDTFGISCVGVAERTAFVETRLESLAGMAISWQCQGVGNYLARTRVSRSCREKGPRSCGPGPRECYLQPDVYVGNGSAGTLALLDAEVEASGCAAPLGAELVKPELELLIRGGRYAAGPEATRPVRFQAVDVVVEGDAAFAETTLEFGPGARGIVGPAVRVTGSRDPFRVDGAAQVLACPVEPSRCAKLCAAERPPRWCAVPPPVGRPGTGPPPPAAR